MPSINTNQTPADTNSTTLSEPSSSLLTTVSKNTAKARNLLGKPLIAPHDSNRLGQKFNQSTTYTFLVAVQKGNIKKVKSMLKKYPYLTEESNRIIFTAYCIVDNDWKNEVKNELLKVNPKLDDGDYKSDGTLLHVAASKGNIEEIKDLLSINANLINGIYGDAHETALNSAARFGQIEVAKYLIEIKAELAEKRDRHGDTALHQAAKYGHLEIVKSLIEINPAFAGKVNSARDTALHNAAEAGQVEVAKYLIEIEPELAEKQNRYGNTALHNAAKYGHLAIIRNLIRINPAFALQENMDGDTALPIAALRGHLEIVKYFLKRSLELYNLHPIILFRQALDYGVRGESLEIVKYCLKTCPEFYVSPEEIISEKTYINAVNNDHLEIVQHLSKYVPLESVRTEDSLERNFAASFLLSAVKNGHLKLVKYVMKTSEYLNTTITEKMKASILLASHSGYSEIVMTLLDSHPILASLIHEDRNTLLHLAAQVGHLELVKLILEIDISDLHVNLAEKENRLGLTPLHFASQEGHLEVVKHILSINPNFADQEDLLEMNSVHLAARRGHIEVVKYLLNTKPQLAEKANVDSQTPLDLAHEFGQTEIVALLEKSVQELKLSSDQSTSSTEHSNTLVNTSTRKLELINNISMHHLETVNDFIEAKASLLTSLNIIFQKDMDLGFLQELDFDILKNLDYEKMSLAIKAENQQFEELGKSLLDMQQKFRMLVGAVPGSIPNNLKDFYSRLVLSFYQLHTVASTIGTAIPKINAKMAYRIPAATPFLSKAFAGKLVETVCMTGLKITETATEGLVVVSGVIKGVGKTAEALNEAHISRKMTAFANLFGPMPEAKLKMSILAEAIVLQPELQNLILNRIDEINAASGWTQFIHSSKAGSKETKHFTKEDKFASELINRLIKNVYKLRKEDEEEYLRMRDRFSREIGLDDIEIKHLIKMIFEKDAVPSLVDKLFNRDKPLANRDFSSLKKADDNKDIASSSVEVQQTQVVSTQSTSKKGKAKVTESQTTTATLQISESKESEIAIDSEILNSIKKRQDELEFENKQLKSEISKIKRQQNQPNSNSKTIEISSGSNYAQMQMTFQLQDQANRKMESSSSNRYGALQRHSINLEQDLAVIREEIDFLSNKRDAQDGRQFKERSKQERQNLELQNKYEDLERRFIIQQEQLDKLSDLVQNSAPQKREKITDRLRVLDMRTLISKNRSESESIGKQG